MLHKLALELSLADPDAPPLQIKDAVGNDYGRPKDVVGENRYAFTSVADSAFDVCFENILESSKPPPRSSASTQH